MSATGDDDIADMMKLLLKSTPRSRTWMSVGIEFALYGQSSQSVIRYYRQIPTGRKTKLRFADLEPRVEAVELADFHQFLEHVRRRCKAVIRVLGQQFQHDVLKHFIYRELKLLRWVWQLFT